MFHFLGWLLGFAPWGKWSECDRAIEFDYVSFSGRRAHHPIYVHWLVERIIGPTMIKGVYPGGGDHEYAFLISRMQRIRDMETGRLVRPHRFTEWLKGVASGMTLPDQQIVLFSLLAFDMQRQDAQCDWRARADFLRVGSAFSKCRIVIRIA